MAKLTEEAKKAISEIYPGLVATASKTGRPNVSAKGSLRVLDDEHLIFADTNSPRTVANLRENPQVAIIWLNAATRKGCRVWGQAEIFDSGELMDWMNTRIAPRTARHVIKVKVEEALVF